MKAFLAICSLRFGIIFLSAIAIVHITTARADDGELTFCNFGPKVNVVETSSSSSKGSDPCAEKVHIQGVLWKCGSNGSVSDTVSHFFDRLDQEAREECRKHCEQIGSNCHSFYRSKSGCGLSTDHDEAVKLGKEFGCRSDCSEGKAFTYCSIYNAGYQGPNPSAILPQAPNCECRSSH